VSPRQFIKLIKQSSTLSGLSIILFTVAGIFGTYTMIAPIMYDYYGASPSMVSAGLLIYGLAGLVGNLFVRRASAVLSAYCLGSGFDCYLCSSPPFAEIARNIVSHPDPLAFRL
jgi:predicted MFS family arabinose efflux permease